MRRLSTPSFFVYSATATTLCLIAVAAAGCSGRERRPRSVPISVGDSVEGRLEEGDWTDVFMDRSYTDLYEIHLDAGQEITVNLRSKSFDTYAALLRGPGDTVVQNDDVSGDNTNSRFSYLAHVKGRYFIGATTFRAGAGGAYELTVTDSSARDGGPAADAAPAPSKRGTADAGQAPQADAAAAPVKGAPQADAAAEPAKVAPQADASSEPATGD